MSTDFAAFLGQLGIAAIFVVAWFRAEGEREKMRVAKDAEIAQLNEQMRTLQTQHRKEMLELLRDIVAGKDTKAALREVE